MIGFIFDLDGVITDTARDHYEAWKYLGEQLGITIDETFNEQLKGISRMDSLEMILKYGGKDAQFSLAEKKEFMKLKNDFYVERLNNLTTENVLPGVKAFIEGARMNEIPCAIASASKNAPFILEKLGIKQMFHHIVDPDSLSKGKPDPEIFLRAAELLQISPTNAVGFEDAQAGIDAIKSCGMFAVGITSESSLENADITIESLAELSIDALLYNLK